MRGGTIFMVDSSMAPFGRRTAESDSARESRPATRDNGPEARCIGNIGITWVDDQG